MKLQLPNDFAAIFHYFTKIMQCGAKFEQNAPVQGADVFTFERDAREVDCWFELAFDVPDDLVRRVL